MDNLGQQPAAERRSLWSRRGFRIALGVALVLGVGGASYGIAAAVSGGSTSTAPTSTTPGSTAPGATRPGSGGFGARGLGTSGTVESVRATSFADVKVGAVASAVGPRRGATVLATRVVIGVGRGGGGFPAGGPRTVGTVASVGSDSFVLKTTSGGDDTVKVIATTTFTEPGTTSVSLKSLKSGDRVFV